MELLPPRILDPELFSLFADILAIQSDVDGNARLRLSLIQNNARWQELADLAETQGALYPFIWALGQRSLLLPLRSGGQVAENSPTAQLTSAYQVHTARRDHQRDQLIGIVSALNRGGIEPLLLKGCRYLLAPTGPWNEARDMRDIDLLVHCNDSRRSVELLKERGYSAGEGVVAPVDQHLPELWMTGAPSAVEIHTEALSYAARSIWATDDVWARGERFYAEGITFFALTREWHLLHGLLNHQISDRGHARHLLAVKPLWEFARLGSELADAEWKAIADHMAARDQGDVLGSWLVQAGQLFGLAAPRGVEISRSALAHAQATFAAARAPGWLRRCRFLADQLRFGFDRETMAVRYKIDPADVSLATWFRHLNFLKRRYRGRLLDRLFGYRRQQSP